MASVAPQQGSIALQDFSAGKKDAGLHFLDPVFHEGTSVQDRVLLHIQYMTNPVAKVRFDQLHTGQASSPLAHLYSLHLHMTVRRTMFATQNMPRSEANRWQHCCMNASAKRCTGAVLLAAACCRYAHAVA